MKITRTSSSAPAAAGQGAKRSTDAVFTLPEAEETAAPARTSSADAVAGVGSLDALIALQEVDGPLTRRKRAVSRAGRLLDALDQIKLALIDGEPSAETLQRLAAAVREERDGADDPALQALLDQIETRAVVELAKLEVARTPV